MPFRPTSCKCAGYTAPRFDPRVTNGPGPHPKLPTDLSWAKDIAELERRVAEKDNLNSTKIGYVGAGKPIPPPEDADDPAFEAPLLELTGKGYAG